MKQFTKEAGAALTFGILYSLMWIYMLFMYFTHRYKWASRFTLLFFHATIRVASQACGVAFGILAFSNVNVFIAYLILGAEGYFTLTLAAYYFLKDWHYRHIGWSFLAPAHVSARDRRSNILKYLFIIPLLMPWLYWKDHMLEIFHAVLIPANALIIAGGSLLAGTASPTDNQSAATLAHNENTAKILRTVGTAAFFAMTVAFGFSLLATVNMAKTAYLSPRQPTLFLFAVLTIFLYTRGVFGLLQACVDSLSYFSSQNFTGTGFTSRFTALEYCLTVLPEFCSAFLLNMSYWTNQHDDTAENVDRNVNEKPGVTHNDEA